MYKKIIFAALFLIGEMESRSTVAAKKIKITKMYHHESDLKDQLVLYFSSAPDCLYIPKRGVVDNQNQPFINAQGMKELNYFFPVHGMTARDINKFTAKVDSIKHNDYRISMHYDHHKEGVSIKICFDDQKVGFQYESFTTITGEHALSFGFFKRMVLDSDKFSKSLFNTAYAGKKKI